jgi:hypothetical protein
MELEKQNLRREFEREMVRASPIVTKLTEIDELTLQQDKMNEIMAMREARHPVSFLGPSSLLRNADIR